MYLSTFLGIFHSRRSPAIPGDLDIRSKAMERHVRINKMHRLRIGYTHGENAKWVIYARNIGYLGGFQISICDTK